MKIKYKQFLLGFGIKIRQETRFVWFQTVKQIDQKFLNRSESQYKKLAKKCKL